VAVFVFVNVPLVNVPFPLNVIALDPPMLELAVILNKFDKEKLPLLLNVPPAKTNELDPNAPLAPICNVPPLRVVVPV